MSGASIKIRPTGQTVSNTVQTTGAVRVAFPNPIDIPTDSSYSFVSIVTGTESATGDTSAYELIGTIRNDGGVTTLVDSFSFRSLAEDTGAETWDRDVAVVGNTLEHGVTGEAAHTIEWKHETELSKLSF